MTLSTTTSKVSYAGDGSTTVFAVPFLFLANGDITAVLRDAAGAETIWVESTQYTLTGAGNPSGGTLTVKTTPTDYTPASGETLVIHRVVAETQGTDYPEGGAFPASAHEQALDRLTMLVQQHSEELARSPHYPVSDSTSISAEIPNSTDRASKFLAFDAVGEPIASAGSVDMLAVSAFVATLLDDATAAAFLTTLGITSFIRTLLDDANAAAARTTLAAAAIGANTFTGVQTLGTGATIDANDKIVGKPVLKDYGETVNAIGSTGGGTQDFDITLGNVVSATVDTSANTFTFSNPSTSGTACSFTLILTNGGSQTVNWPASVDWPGGTAPALTAAGVDILVFTTTNGGTTWHGMLASEDSK